MRCPRCQQENPAKAKFCNACGTRLDLLCSRCGQLNPPGSRFCNECGQPVDAAPAPALQVPAPEAYIPKHLAEKILTSKSALEGERKQVTVLFADLKGSMELLADRDPEEARRLLDPVLEHMMAAVHRYEGTVNQVMGDGIMALFGAPVAHEDHAVRACYAALRMQELVAGYAEGVFRSHGVPVQIRVGLNAGVVVVRSIGSDLHMDYTAVGQTTHLAARLEQMARPGSILISADTLPLVEGYVQVKSLGPVTIKGLESPVEVYELLGGLPVRSRMEAAAARGLTPFVGRARELEALRHALTQGHAGHGQVVGVVGEPGVGKTRLFYEFTHSHSTQGWLVLETWSMSYGKASAYLPVLELLKSYFQFEARDDARRMREKVTGKLLTLDPALQPTLPAFLALLDVPGEDPQWQALDPAQRRQRTLEALKRLVLRESQVQPLCFVVENLHWIDTETQAWLDSLIEGLPTARCLLLVNFRPEFTHGWGQKTYYTQLRLDPLPPESAEQLLQALLGADPSLQPLKQLLIERTEGNPFFLEESVHTLVETHVLTGARGAYRLATALPSILVPPTVQAVLAARIDRLPPEEKRLLQAAAVVGKDVPFPLLQAIAELPEEALRQGLTHLQAAEFLYELSLFPDPEYTFKHALTHQVAYGSLLHERRGALHAKIVDSIEALDPHRLREHLERLAHHEFRGEMWEKARAYLRQAGLKAAARSAYREAAECFERALEASRHLPQDRPTVEEAIELRFALRNALWPIGEFARILPHLRDAQEAAGTLGDQPRLGRTFSYLTQYFWMVGEHTQAIETGQRALAIAGALGDIEVQVPTNLHVGLAYHASGDYRQAVEVLRRNVNILEGALAREHFGLAALPSVYSRTWLAWSLAELGQFAEALARGQEAVTVADTVDQPLSRVNACFASGYVYLQKGELPQATDVLERGFRVCQSLALPFWQPVAASLLGAAYARYGRLAEAVPILEQAVAQAVSMRRNVDQALWHAYLSEAYLLAGRTEDARRTAAAAITLARESAERGNEARILRLLGEIESQPNTPENEIAATYYRQALALADGLGMRPLVAHCHLGLGTLYLRTGEREQGRDHLTTAAAMYRKMDMRLWLEQAEAEAKEFMGQP